MSVDFNNFDAVVNLSADRRRGIWAVQTRLHRGRSSRVAGQIETESSAHTLLVIAMLTGLAQITKQQAAKLVESAAIKITKPRIQVVCRDLTFLSSLRERMQGQKLTPNKAAKHILMQLPKQLARFTLSFQTNPDDATCYTLQSWAFKSVHDPKLIDIPRAFTPSVVSDLQ